MPDLGSLVHQRPLASTAGGGDGYSPGYSVLAPAETKWSLDLLTQRTPHDLDACSTPGGDLGSTWIHENV
jgi:hypothetical protein